ncbi:hypothetical protein GCM10009700_22470 [Brevibacterium sanguinis]|jgi:hypothetical protein
MLLNIPTTPGVGFAGATGRGVTIARGETGGKGSALSRADNGHRMVSTMLQFVHAEHDERWKIDRVIGVEVGDEHASEVTELKARLADPASDPMAGIDEVEPISDDDRRGDPRTVAKVPFPPPRSPGSPQGDDFHLRFIHIVARPSASLRCRVDVTSLSQDHQKKKQN